MRATMFCMKRAEMSWEEKRVRQWVMSHKGILSTLAVQHGCSPQFVQAIAYGKSTALPGHVVETALRRAGWPGIRKHA